MKNCVVTGALGFLGSRIVREFADEGYRVVGVGREEHPSAELEARGLAAYHALDMPSAALAGILLAERPDAVVHAAGPASVAGSLMDPVADFDGTVGVLAHLLDSVRANSPDSRLVVLSSAAVYGNPPALPVRESAPARPLSPYGYHKYLAEMLLKEYHEVYGLHTCAARVFSAYGEGLRRQILWDVCEKAMAGDVELFGTGDETRDLVHADDVASAVRIMCEDAPMIGGVYNVASGEETSIRDLASMVVQVVRPDAVVSFSGELRHGDPFRWRADISAIRELGFSPCVGLAQGVTDYCAWYLSAKVDS